ncbi:YafY family protein [soil metagenome]
MPARISRTQRWLDLLSFLVGRRLPVSVSEIMERVPAYAAGWASDDPTKRETARRTFERDKDGLRKMGIPLETVRYTVGYGTEQAEGYRVTRRDFYLPYLKLVAGSRAEWSYDDPARIGTLELSAEEAGDALHALGRVARLADAAFAAEARTAYAKLGFDLDPETLPADPVHFARPAADAAQAATLRTLADALLARRRVHLRYRAITAEATERTVRPYVLAFSGGAWYLVGHDESRDAIRTLRVGRVEDAKTEKEEAAYEIPPDFSLRDRVGGEPWELGDGEPLAVDVRFRFPLSLRAERNAYGELVETGDDGAALRRFAVRQSGPLLRWLLTLEGDAEIVSPPQLRSDFQELARAVAAVYKPAARA